MPSSFQESIFRPSKRVFFFWNIIFSPAKSQIEPCDRFFLLTFAAAFSIVKQALEILGESARA
jgi:hypothetical protein